jgi:hypothetical protein
VHPGEAGFMSYAVQADWRKFRRHATRLDHSEPVGALDSDHFPASYRDGTAIGATQFLRPDNMQSSWREMSISFINKK